MDAKKLAMLCREYADDKKAEDLVVIDVRKLSSVTDYFVVATGTSEPHLRAIINSILDRLHDEHGIHPNAVEGKEGGSLWVVMDFFDVIVHVMRGDVRKQYDLEGLWGDAPRVKQGRKAAAKAA
jgi:ribosome-associated protein